MASPVYLAVRAHEHKLRQNGVMGAYLFGRVSDENLMNKVDTDTFANALVAAQTHLGYAGSPPSTAAGLAQLQAEHDAVRDVKVQLRFWSIQF